MDALGFTISVKINNSRDHWKAYLKWRTQSFKRTKKFILLHVTGFILYGICFDIFGII